MKKQLVRGLGFLAVIVIIAASTSTNAQTLEYKITADIPFDFSVADKTLPAGEYSFRRSQTTDGDQVVQITSRDGQTVVTRITIPVITITPKRTAHVIFRRYGEQYFLSEVWPATALTGRSLPRSRSEREIARKIQENVTIVANVR